jgi:hypothetical protein
MEILKEDIKYLRPLTTIMGCLFIMLIIIIIASLAFILGNSLKDQSVSAEPSTTEMVIATIIAGLADQATADESEPEIVMSKTTPTAISMREPTIKTSTSTTTSTIIPTSAPLMTATSTATETLAPTLTSTPPSTATPELNTCFSAQFNIFLRENPTNEFDNQVRQDPYEQGTIFSYLGKVSLQRDPDQICWYNVRHDQSELEGWVAAWVEREETYYLAIDADCNPDTPDRIFFRDSDCDGVFDDIE